MNPQEIIAEAIEHVRSCWRYRWWAVTFMWLVSAVGWAYVFTIPNVYQASTRVYVDTNSLLRPLMQGLTAQQNPMSEVQLVSTAVLTRPNLAAVAREANLDANVSTPEELDALLTRLQRRITVRGGRDNVFTIEYQDTDRDVARNVVAAVLETFVQKAIGAQGDDAEITEAALASEIREHENRLNAAEVALAEFKKINIGYMPSDSGDYYARLQTALGLVARTQERIRQLEARRDELRRQIEGEDPVFGIMPQSPGQSCSQRAQIAELQAQLSRMLVEFTDKHPRLVTLQETIATLEARCAEEAATLGVAAGSAERPLELNPVYQNLRIQQSNVELELAEARGQLQSHEAAVAALRRDVDKIAEVETQLRQLNRDYNVIQSRHQQLLARWEDLQAKKRLDPLTDNVQFRRIEPPFALAEPVGPNRPMLLGGVLFLAIAGGVALAFGLGQLRPVYFTRFSMRRLSGVPILGTVSMVWGPGARLRRRLATLAWVGACVLLLASTAALMAFSPSVYELLRNDSGIIAS